MALKQMLRRLRTTRIFVLVLAAVARGLLAGEMRYVILDDRLTAMCWFYANMEGCMVASLSASLLMIVSASYLILEVLGSLDFAVRRLVTVVLLYVDGLLAGQLALLFLGSWSYMMVQWIRTLVDWPYITLDHNRHVCPDSDDCTIPVHIHYCAMIVLVSFIMCLCMLTVQVFRIKKVLAVLTLPNDES